MARRSGVEGFLRAAARAAAASERERQRALRADLANSRRIERDERVARNQQIRESREAERLAKKEYLEDRIEETADLNNALDEVVQALNGLLAHTLSVNDSIRFSDLKKVAVFEVFSSPQNLLPSRPPVAEAVPSPSWMAKLIPGARKRFEIKKKNALELHEKRVSEFKVSEEKKKDRLLVLVSEYDKRKTVFEEEQRRHNSQVDDFEAAYFSKDPDAISTYCEMVLERSEYPDLGFPQKYKIAYSASSSELVVEYDLPEMSVVPDVSEYKYVKATDLIDSKPRKAAERKKLYQDVVAAVSLRTVHELLEADQANALNVLTFTGVVDTSDPASGKPVRVPLISVRVTKQEFMDLHLDKVDKVICLKNLGAQVSSRPDELQAVKPIIEFDMVDRRFIEQGDALGSLEARPNLLEMTPSEFEVLVANLFGKMGLESKLTRASRDGGVDAIAYDARPVLGGKVVIQAKRYRNTVGVEAVRDLYGTMLNEGANKGILVTTSGYGSDAYSFSKDKPIELIDGGGLLYLLREHAGLEARIVS